MSWIDWNKYKKGSGRLSAHSFLGDSAWNAEERGLEGALLAGACWQLLAGGGLTEGA